jgi:hypothetical protein
MNSRLHAAVAYALCACVAGCAAPRASPVATIPAHNARDAIIVGTSTKADVIAAFGKTEVISFDSGFEVWVYPYEGDAPAKPKPVERTEPAASGSGSRGKSEFVILFAPSGVVTKTRVRPAPTPGAAKRP